MLRGKRVWSLGYTIVVVGNAVPGALAASAAAQAATTAGSAAAPLVSDTCSARLTVAEPDTPHPASAVTVTVPPALAFGVNMPADASPGGVSSARVAVQYSSEGSSLAVWPSEKVPVAVNAIGVAVLPSTVVLAVGGSSVIAV